MASQEGLEPPTTRLEGECSIQLSYWDTRVLLYHTMNSIRKAEMDIKSFSAVQTSDSILARSPLMSFNLMCRS